MSLPIRLDPIEPENLEQAVAIAQEIFPYEVHPEGGFWPETAYKMAIEAKDPKWVYHIVKCGMTAVGITGHYPDDDEPNTLWLGWFGIREGHRRQGHGLSALLETVLKMQSLGANKVKSYCGVRPEEAMAHPFYKLAGFNFVEEIEVEGKPCKVYELPIQTKKSQDRAAG